MNKNTLLYALIVLPLATAPMSAAAKPAPKQPQPVVVRASVIHTMVAGSKPIADGIVVVERGVIRCIGPQSGTCKAPAGARVVHVKGGVLVPGLVEASTFVGLEEISLEPGSGDGHVARVRNAAHVRAIDGVTMASRVVKATRNGGVTAVVAHPMSRALLTGQSVAYVTAGKVVDDALIRAPAAVHVNLRGGHDSKHDGLVGARSGRLAALRDVLAKARALAEAKKDDAYLSKLRRDPALKPLVAVIKGAVPLAVHAHRADTITAALRLAAEFKLKLVIVGGHESHVVAARLARAKVPVVLSPGRVQPYSFDTLRAVDDVAARLHRKGVTVALSTGSAHNARHLRWQAGWAIDAGLPRDVALAAITTTPAQIFGFGDKAGTLEAGKDASFVLFDGDPVSIRSHIHAVSVRGRLTIKPKQR